MKEREERLQSESTLLAIFERKRRLLYWKERMRE
jgi:hypothetical protein